MLSSNSPAGSRWLSSKNRRGIIRTRQSILVIFERKSRAKNSQIRGQEKNPTIQSFSIFSA
jgi:hypothetical protein